MEIKGSWSLDGECGTTVYTQSAIDNHRLWGDNNRVVADNEMMTELGIPGVGSEVHLLFRTAFEQEHQVVLNELGLFTSVPFGGEFHEHADAVSLSHIKPRHLASRGIVEMGTVDVHSESGLIALFESHLLQPQSVVALVVDPEGSCTRGYTAEEGVHAHGIGREG